MPIAYPTYLEALLSTDRQLRSGVDHLIVLFDGWLTTSRLPFFEDYTDHGIEHLNGVLETAHHLISPQAREHFSAADAAALITATLFHDSALHLSEAGFLALITGSPATWQIAGFNDQPWPTLWDDYLFSARRWDERRLHQVFGDVGLDPTELQLLDPFSHYENLTTVDRKLIGEFIRLHHARLAHEFAVFGVPGVTTIDVSGVLSADFRDVSGLIARSHGMPVRGCLDYLALHYHRREFARIHAVYLMTLLRIADHLQIQAQRAPAIVFQYRHIPSSRSTLEWQAHNAITNITHTHDDPESIEIQAQPQDVRTFLRLREWLAGIQKELDDSWAVLGETYGLHPRLGSLGLILRRVRSNLDDPLQFAKHVNYIPSQVELTVARPDLLKLLVGPLYDNIPSIGVRELVQNAVDAVREREFLQAKHAELRGAGLREQKSDVEVFIGKPDDQGSSWLKVSDRGAGMSLDTLRDYFLTAGASFRDSDTWKRDFAGDVAGESRVLRSGRFGVGVLACFLLGSRVEVATRHIRADHGYKFSMTLTPEPLEILRDDTLRVGTSIRVEISEAVRRELLEAGARVSIPEKFDWFIYDHPKVTRIVDEEDAELVPAFEVTPPSEPEALGFRRLQAENGCAVYWTFRQLPSLSVNGVFVTNSRTLGGGPGEAAVELYGHNGAGLHTRIMHPRICVDDPEAVFPLNLRRTSIVTRGYGFSEELTVEVVDDFLAYLLVRCPSSIDDPRWTQLGQHPGVRLRSWEKFVTTSLVAYPFVASRAGLSMIQPRLSTDGSATRLFVMPTVLGTDVLSRLSSEQSLLAMVSREQDYGQMALAGRVLRSDGVHLQTLELASALRGRGSGSRLLAGGRHVEGIRVAVPTNVARKALEPDRWVADLMATYEEAKKERGAFLPLRAEELEGLVRRVCRGLEVEEECQENVWLVTGQRPPKRISTLAASEVVQSGIVEAFLGPPDPGVPGSRESLVTKRWNEVFGVPVIPFSASARKAALATAYDVLARFVAGQDAMMRANVNA